MEPEVLFLVILVVVAGIVGVVLALRKHLKGSIEAGETVDVLKLVDEYSDRIMSIVKDIILIKAIKEEDFQNLEDYDNAVVDLVTARLINIIYQDYGMDEKFRVLVNESSVRHYVKFIYEAIRDNMDVADEISQEQLLVKYEKK